MITSAPSAPQSYTGIVGPGQTLPVAVVGTQFYFPVASGQLWARQSGGLWASFVQGTGQDCGQQFSQVEINNPGTSPLVFQIVASANNFLDHRLVTNISTPNIIKVQLSTAWTGSNPYNLVVNDLSGTAFTDSIGATWIAIQRVSLTVQLLTTGTLSIAAVAGAFNVGTFTSTGAPVDPITLNCSGRFVMSYDNTSGPVATVPVAVYEIYQAVQPGFAANPPN